jgi:hypothetical protein
MILKQTWMEEVKKIATGQTAVSNVCKKQSKVAPKRNVPVTSLESNYLSWHGSTLDKNRGLQSGLTLVIKENRVSSWI